MPRLLRTGDRPVPEPDLLLQVSTIWSEDRRTLTYHYRLEQSDQPAPSEEDDVSPTLDASWLAQARGWLADALDETAGALPEEARQRLMSLGLHRTVLPARLRDVLREPETRDTTLLVVADQDAWLPWELMHDGQTFWAERFVLGRWLREIADTRPYELPLGPMSVSHYAEVERPESWAGLLDAPVPELQARLLAGGVLGGAEAESIHGLHLIRQGQTPEASDDDLPRLAGTSGGEDVDGNVRSAKLNLRRNRPIVSLGYLRAGRPEPTGLDDTWAPAFLHAGCSAFVGPLWAVSPAVEAAFVSSFYRRMWAGQALGSAFVGARKEARAAAPESLDSLAYVLFGDPTARPYRPVDGEGYAVVEPIGRAIDDKLRRGDAARFRVSLRRAPPVWHAERLVEVTRELDFDDLQVHVAPGRLQASASPVEMRRTPSGDYLGWFTLRAPADLDDDEALAQVYFVDGVRTIHSVMLSFEVTSAEGGDDERL